MSAPPVLRNYQAECLKTIWERYKTGVRRQLVCLPTGTGKTVVFAQFPQFFRMRNRMLVLAHREELLDQAAQKIRHANPDLRVNVEQANRRASSDSDVVVASVATLGRKDSPRLAALDPDQFHLLVVDEAHHAAAASWRRTLNHFGVFEDNTRKLLVGFTATPKRTDGAGLDEVFQEIVFSRELPRMIAEGFLAPVAAYRLETDVDLSGVRTRMGDFVTGQLAGAINTQSRNDIVVKVYNQYVPGKKTVCFCVDVDHATSLAETFEASGVKAATITGGTPSNERQSLIKGFRAGDIEVLTNCMVLTEGYDEPSIESIILARPTKSNLLYTQMVGRGTRLHPNKSHVVVIDIVDVTRDHSLITLPGLFGFSDRFNMEGKTTTELEEILRWVAVRRPWVRVEHAESITDLRYRCRRVDLRDLATPPEIKKCSNFAWLNARGGIYSLPLGSGERVVVSSTLLNTWEVTVETPGSGPEPVSTTKTLPKAIAAAEAFVEDDREEALKLVGRNLSWRSQDPSDRQLEIIAQHNVELPDGFTRGDASRVIGMLPRKSG